MSTETEILSYRDAIARTMRQALAEHPHTLLLGQGVNDFKGTFGTTQDLFKEFGGDRVLDLPLCEEASTGLAVGAAMNGLYPIHVHIRADFVFLAMNQIVNMAAKMSYMSDGRVHAPMLIRLVVGRSWGQGAQHSQSPHAMFAHVPGLTVVTPGDSQSILDLYPWLIANHRSPVVSLEHRLLYDVRFPCRTTPADASPLTSRIVRRGTDVTVVANSIMVLEAVRAAKHLAPLGIDCEVIDLVTPSHFDRAAVLDSIRRTGRLVVADNSWLPYGIGGEISRIIAESDPGLLRAPARFIGMQWSPCPTAKVLEDAFYPSQDDLVDAIATVVTGRRDHGVPPPGERSMADVYKKFKGPF